VFSRKPRAPERLEIVYSGESFRWQEDHSVNLRARKKQVWALSLGFMLAVVVLGGAMGISWHFSAVADDETLFISGPG
jgi:hypothetical protein